MDDNQAVEAVPEEETDEWAAIAMEVVLAQGGLSLHARHELQVVARKLAMLEAGIAP